MHKLPSAETVALTLTTFLRRNVEVTPATVPERLPIVGLYCSSAEVDIAVCESDIAFAAITAASFALIPAPVAKESISEDKLEEGLQDIFAEVLNVLSRLFSDADGTRITLSDKVFPPASIPEKVAQRPASYIGFEVEVDGYGKGYLGLGLLEAV